MQHWLPVAYQFQEFVLCYRLLERRVWANMTCLLQYWKYLYSSLYKCEFLLLHSSTTKLYKVFHDSYRDLVVAWYGTVCQCHQCHFVWKNKHDILTRSQAEGLHHHFVNYLLCTSQLHCWNLMEFSFLQSNSHFSPSASRECRLTAKNWLHLFLVEHDWQRKVLSHLHAVIEFISTICWMKWALWYMYW